jgi:hypothetical protein
MITTIPDRERDLQAQVDALKEELARLRAQEPVALKSVHLIRDVQGMCAVLVNGRMAIRDNGDIIDHFATLDWFAAPPSQPAKPVQRLSDDDIDRTLATTLDALAKMYGIDHAMHVRTDIAEHHTLRRAFARAIESALQTKATK